MCLIETCKTSGIFISYILAFFLFLWRRLGEWQGGICAKHMVLSKRCKSQYTSHLQFALRSVDLTFKKYTWFMYAQAKPGSHWCHSQDLNLMDSSSSGWWLHRKCYEMGAALIPTREKALLVPVLPSHSKLKSQSHAGFSVFSLKRVKSSFTTCLGEQLAP